MARLPARAPAARSARRGRRARRRAAPPRRTAPGPSAPARRREAFRGEPTWTPQRRFSRVFERLALPGFARAARFELLTALGAAGRYELEAGELQLTAGEDATTEAAKRLLVSGDKLLLERRARDLAEAAEVPLGGARPRARGLGHAGRPRRPGRRGACADPGGPLAAVSAQAVPAPPRRGGRAGRRRAGRAARRLPMPLLLLACLALAALSLLLPLDARPTTRGPGSSGAARSPSGTS